MSQPMGRAVMVVAVGLAFGAGCKTAGKASDSAGGKPAAELSDADLGAIRAVDSSFAAAANAGSADSVAAVYATNAALLPPNMPPQKGRDCHPRVLGRVLRGLYRAFRDQLRRRGRAG